MKKQQEHCCWNYKNNKFKSRDGVKIATPFCLEKGDWFPDGWDFAKIRECKYWR